MGANCALVCAVFTVHFVYEQLDKSNASSAESSQAEQPRGLVRQKSTQAVEFAGRAKSQVVTVVKDRVLGTTSSAGNPGSSMEMTEEKPAEEQPECV